MFPTIRTRRILPRKPHTDPRYQRALRHSHRRELCPPGQPTPALRRRRGRTRGLDAVPDCVPRATPVPGELRDSRSLAQASCATARPTRKAAWTLDSCGVAVVEIELAA